MNLSRSLKRLSWRFSKGNFTPSQEDINCLLEVIEYVDRKEKQQLIDNQLFGKLYIFVFGELIRHYEATPESDIPQKELHKILDKNLKTIVNEFTDKVNNAKLAHVTNENDLKAYNPIAYEESATNLRIMVNAAINTYK